MTFLKSLARLRKPAIIVVVILAVAAGGYFGYDRLFRSQPDATAQDMQTVPVRRGDLIEQVSISGSVDFPDSERLVFGTAGTVEEVNVTQGERVSEGDALASLDPETIAGLEQALAQANIDLRDAEDALKDFLETPPLTLAQANQAVVKARADIVNAEDALDKIANPSEHRIAEARAAISAAELKLRQEQDALDDLLKPPTDISVTRAETNIVAKRLAVQRAEKALDDLLKPPTDISVTRAETNIVAKRLAVQRAEKALEDMLKPPTEAAVAVADERIAKARSALDAAKKRRDDYKNQEGIANVRRRIEKAQVAVQRAERDLSVARYDTGKSMQDSTDALDAAAKNYVDQFFKWLGMKVSIDDLDPDYAKTLSDMGIDLADAFSDSRKELDLRGSNAPLGPPDDPDTPFDDRVVFAWLSQAPFAIDPTCAKDDDIPLYTVCVENEFRTNGDAYKTELDTWNSANLTATKTVDAALDTLDAAEKELEDAREALADMNVDATKLAEYEAAIVSARAEIDAATEDREKMDDAPTPEEVADLNAKITLAKGEVDEALEDLEKLRERTETDAAAVAVADERIAKARSALDAAEKRRDDYESQEGIADIRRRIEKADVAVQRAERDLSVARYDTGKSMQDSTDALDAAAKNYVDQFFKWLGMKVSIDDLDPDYAKTLSDMGIDLADAFSDSRKELDLRGSNAPLGPPDDPDTPFDDRVVFAWLSQAPFAIDPTCAKDDDIPLYTVCVENEFRTNGDAYKTELDTWNSANLTATKTVDAALDTLDAAEKELEDAREALADMNVDATKLAEYEAAIVSARAEIDAATEDREKMDDAPTPEEVADQNAKITLAKGEVDEALEDLEKLRERTETDAAAVADARERIKVAEAAIAEREDDLAKLLLGEEHPDYAAASEDVKVANRALAEREKELRELTPEGRDALRESLLTLNIDAAKSTVSQAARRLDDATLTAPWDGFVSQVEVKEGDKVESGALAVELVNTNVVEIDGGVDEIDVLRIELGTSAEVTLDALEGQTLTGGVSFIDAAASSSQGIVSIPVKVRLDDPGDLQIPKGVSAVATITIKEVRDVLLVPQRALRGTFTAPTLQIMVGEETTEVPVVIGESDDFMVVIESGVSEGDIIVAGPDDGSFVDGFGGPGGGPGGNGPPGDGPRGERGGGP